jgi:hypothetical protein
MATPTLKSTFSLDLETAQTLEALSRRWRVSKSEALRRAIRGAAAAPAAGADAAIRALEALQRSMALTPAAARAWERRVRTERRASSRRSEARR